MPRPKNQTHFRGRISAHVDPDREICVFLPSMPPKELNLVYWVDCNDINMLQKQESRKKKLNVA